ncbi:MAG: DNA-3-methyladenine glycosylase I [Bacteroidales bacterium]|nr:DNA-3-methyladenine glycosylase I [Bacteroidales bacterium]
MKKQSCEWPLNDPLMIAYHDTEWGVPVHDDKKWFEFIVLDTFQAGLSWRTVLHKRESFRAALDGFDFEKIALYGEPKIGALLENPRIIRNKLKIRSCISNAQAFIRVRAEHGSFDSFIWKFVNGKPIINKWASTKQIPATSPESDLMSKELKKLGFKFVGSTTCYAFMQAGGMINDHLTDCFRYREVGS